MPKTPITTAEHNRAAANLKKAKVQLTIMEPFYASLVMRHKITLDEKITTACVNAKGDMRIGVRLAAGCTVRQLQTVLCHEIMHPALGHFHRKGFRKARAWNMAGDKVINAILQKSGFEPLVNVKYHPDEEPITWVCQSDGDKYAAEQLYSEDDDGDDSEYEPGEGGDDMSDDPVDEVEARELEAQWKVEIAQAARTAKARGNMPGHLERLVDEVVNPVTPWHILLERYLTKFIKADYSWKRPNKRHIDAGLYLPSHDQNPMMGEVVIQVDTSGSIGSKELAHFEGHINSILTTCRPEKVYVLFTDSLVCKVDEYALDDLPVKLAPAGGGGTDMRAGIDWVNEQGLDPEVFITLTDGYTPYPDTAPSFPLVWLQTANMESPVGDNIKYQID